MTDLEQVRLIPAPPELPSLEGIALGHAVMVAYERRERCRPRAWMRENAEAQLEKECYVLMAAREWEVQA